MSEKTGLGRLCKEKMTEEALSRFKAHPDFVITSYMGSKVSELENLRRDLKKSSSSYVVMKNSILKIVFEKLKLTDEISKIEGGIGISLAGDDILSTCRVLVTFARTHEKLKIKGAVISGKSVLSERVKELAGIPSKDALISQVLSGIKSPITGFVNTLGGILRKFVYVVDAIRTDRDKKKESGKDGN